MDQSFRLDHRKGFQIGPLLRFVQTGQLIESKAATCFQTAVILLHGFGQPMGGLLWGRFEQRRKHRGNPAPERSLEFVRID